MTLPKHLGGHGNKTHIDEGVLNYLIKEFDVKSMLDIGCGPGGMVDLANQKGLYAVGIDGDFSIERTCAVILHDYHSGPLKHYCTYDLAWSVEFLEHIPEDCIKHVMPSFLACRRVVITSSNNPKPRLHVNPQPPEYWIKIFKQHGFLYSKSITKKLRKLSTMERSFFRDSGSYFINTRK